MIKDRIVAGHLSEKIYMFFFSYACEVFCVCTILIYELGMNWF